MKRGIAFVPVDHVAAKYRDSLERIAIRFGVISSSNGRLLAEAALLVSQKHSTEQLYVF